MGLKIEDISAKTLINVGYLHLLEENNFSNIPAEVMTIGFLRNYSIVLGLNPDEIIAEYRKLNPVKMRSGIGTIIIKDAPIKKTTRITTGTLLTVLFSILLLLGISKIVSTVAKSDKVSKTELDQAEAKKNHLEIKTTDNVWVRVKEGENSIFEGIISPNTIKTFDSAEQFSLRIGNMSGVSVMLNGVPVKLPSDKLVGDITLSQTANVDYPNTSGQSTD